MDHVFQNIRPLFADRLNLPAIEALDRKIHSYEAWAQLVYVNIELNKHTSENYECRVQKIRTEIKSEPLAIDFIGVAPFVELSRRDEVNAPVLATYKRAVGNPPYPFGVGVLGKLARKLGSNWGDEHSLGQLLSAAFDGTLLLFIDHCGPNYHRGFYSGFLIQSASERCSLQKYNIQ